MLAMVRIVLTNNLCFAFSAGAIGINLTQANRVFLLEPAMNPSLEAQAVGRVHRLGQTRPVEIVRLIMKDGIEMRIKQFVETKYSNSKPMSSSSDTSVEDIALFTRPVAPPIVGSLQTDKAAIMAEEFDFLFGVTDSIDLGPVQPLCTSDDYHHMSAFRQDDDDDDDDFEVYYMEVDETPDCVGSGRI